MPVALSELNGSKQVRADHVAVYIRWSTEEQGEGTTEAEQREACEAYVVSQGWKVSQHLVFIDAGYSGGSISRPELSRLRAMVAADEVDCVVAMKVDRLSRSVRDIVALVLEEWEGRCYFRSAREPIDTSTHVGKFSFYLLAAFAEWERETIRERTYGGKVRRAKEGRHLGHAPFGYRSVESDRGQGGLREIVPEEAAAVRHIFRMAAQGLGYRRIGNWLNEQGYQTKNGIRFSGPSVQSIVENPVYMGKAVYGQTRVNPLHKRDPLKHPRQVRGNPIVVDGAQPAIVTEEEWHAAREAVAGRAARMKPAGGHYVSKLGGFNRAVSSEFLLTGLLYSGCVSEMGNRFRMSGKHRWEDGKSQFKYYTCNGKLHGKGHTCTTGYIRCELVDEVVVREFLARYGDQERRAASVRAAVEREVGAGRAALETRRADLAKRQRDAQRRIERYRMDYDQGELSGRRFEALVAGVEAEQEQMAREAAELTVKEAQAKGSLARHDALVQQLAVVDAWESLPVAQKKELLRAGIQEVSVTGNARDGIDIEIKFLG